MGGISHKDFEHIFNAWYEPIRNFLYFKTGDAGLAEDLAQDVFLKVWEKKEGIRIQTIKPFLYTLANNLFLNRQVHQKVLFRFAMEYKPRNINEGPDFDLEVKEFDKKLQDAINGLDVKKRTVFLMNRIEKLTYHQIAENLGITVKAVEKRMEKALTYLKQRIDENI
jgi:RNA polymerase sigma-70 factor (ECF subfamily)